MNLNKHLRPPGQSKHLAPGWRGVFGRACFLLGGVALLICLVLIIYMEFYDQPSVHQAQQGDPQFAASTATDAPQSNPAPQYTQISAADLLSAYDANEVNADNLYKGELLLVTGIVKSIGKDLTDRVYITISEDGSEYNLYTVQCYFEDEDEINNKVATLEQGQTVNVLGTCDGKVLNVALKDCILY